MLARSDGSGMPLAATNREKERKKEMYVMA